MALILECSLSTKQVARLAGITYATLDYWVRPERGNLLQCEIPAKGTGSERRFSFLDTIRVRAVAELRRQHVTLQTIRKVMAELARFGIEDPLVQTGRLVIAGERVFWALDDNTLLDVLKGQLAAKPLVVISMGELVQDTALRVRELCAAA